MISNGRKTSYPLPDNEDQRLRTLHRYNVLDTSPEDSFDRLTDLTRRILDAPVSLISLVDRDREWHKSAAGTRPVENPRDESFCAHAITGDEPLVVEDARKDDRFHDYPLVTGEKTIDLEDRNREIQLVSYAGAPLITDNGARIGTLCVVDDEPRSFSEKQIGILRDLSREVVKQLQLRLKNRKLREARENAEEANRAKSQFLARMSHDLRTPLNVISGVADLLKSSDLTPETREYVTMFKHASETLLNMINDVLDLSKIEAGELELVDQVFRLGEFIDKSVSFLARKAHEKNIELVLDIGPDCPARLVGDPRRLQQIVVNLVSNAIKFTGEGVVILRVRKIDETPERTTLAWEVEDTGPGIPEEDQKKIFQSYKQSRPGFTEDTEGTGLGLDISRHLVRKMGGEIELESEPGEGSVFRFRVPFTKPDDDERPETVMGQYQEQTGSVNLADRTALVVDDHRLSRDLFRTFLEEWGAEVETAGGADEAIELIDDHAGEGRFDLIIIDRIMPGTDGFELVKRIRERDLLSKVVLMVTSDNLKGDLRRVRENDITGYLLKPVTRRRLMTTLKEHFDEAEAPDQTIPDAGVELYDADREPPSVLIAEDSSTSRRIMERYMEEHSVRVQFAENGKEAVSAFRSNDFDLVFMDFRMPEVDGLEATRRIRAYEEEKDLERTPVIALSGDVMEDRKQLGFDAGCDAFEGKPIREEKMLELIQSYAINETSDQD